MPSSLFPLVHCNPAPPHPEPGHLVGAVCPPSLPEIVAIVALFLFVLWSMQYLPGRV